MKAKDIILIALICANACLAAMAGAVYLVKAESRAYAGSESRAGDYIMAAGPITSQRDGLLLIDTVAQRAILYAPRAGATAGGTKWELLSTRSLATDFRGPPK